jgi:hypothetical protein
MYKKKTLRHMSPVTRHYARNINSLQGVLKRFENTTEDIARLELDSRALFKKQEHQARIIQSTHLIFSISEDDVLEVAREKFGLDGLTEEQLRVVKKGVEFGLECWGEVVAAALGEAFRLESEAKEG